MADLKKTWLFSRKSEKHADFQARVETALVEVALNIRQNPANPMTNEGRTLQSWAVRVLPDPEREAVRMMPTLSVMANDAGLIDNNGNITATDTQIRNTVLALAPVFSGYIAEVPV